MHGFLASYALELLFLQHPQELELQVGSHITHFIEKQRALVRQLEPAKLALDGASERALFVPEQLGFQQRIGQSTAVDLDERTCRAARA